MSEGFGILTEEVSWVNLKYEQLYNMMYDCQSGLLDNFSEFCRCYEGEFDTHEDAFDEFVDSYNNDMYGWEGFEGLVVDFLNEQAFGGRDVLRYEDWCIYAAPDIPATAAERQKMVTQEEIQQALDTWLAPLLQGPATAAWHTVRD